MKNIFIAVFVLLSAIFIIQGCSKPKTDPVDLSENLAVTWELIENMWGQNNEDNKCLASFTFINHSKSPLGSEGWIMYFNQATILPNNEFDSLMGKVEHINGDLYRFVPGMDFLLNPGDSIKFKYGYNGILIKESDSPMGVYMVFGGGSVKESIVELKKFLAKPYPGLEKIFPNMPEILATPQNEFAKNQSIYKLDSSQVGKILPTPYQIISGKGKVELNETSVVYYSKELENEAGYLVAAVQKQFGISLQKKEGAGSEPDAITLETAAMQINGISKEAYKLSIRESRGINIIGSDAAGVFYGIQSFLSLVNAENKASVQSKINLNAVDIKDAPRFGYRGFLLDVARNFQSKESLLKLIDVLSMYKINALNLRLTEDEGWRLEIAGLPELTELGSKRGHTTDDADCLPPSFGSGPFKDAANSGNGFYSRTDFVEILKFANQRHIQVVPEICFPSHARAAIKSMEARYRKYIAEGNQKAAEEFRLIDPEDKSVYLSAQLYKDNVVNIAYESCYNFYEKVVEDVAKMYSEAGLELSLFNTGGDEVAKGAWTQSPAIDRLMQSNPELKDDRDLHPYFIDRSIQMLEKYNLTFAGWEEAVLKKDDAGNVEINKQFAEKRFIPYIWDNTGNNTDLGYRVANAGYPIVICNVTNLYFDLAYNTDTKEPGLYWGGFQDNSDAYFLAPFDVFKSAVLNDYGVISTEDKSVTGMELLKPENRKNVVGLQAQLWSETLRRPDMMEYYTLPKLFAYAEKAWAKAPEWETEANAGKRVQKILAGWNELANRIAQHEMPRLDQINGGYNYRIPLPGAVVENDTLKANIAFPGLTIRYTTDGTEPDGKSTLYEAPAKVVGKVNIRAFAPHGRAGRSCSVN